MIIHRNIYDALEFSFFLLVLDQHLELMGQKTKSTQVRLESFQKGHAGILEQVCSHMTQSICVCKHSLCVLKGGVQVNR